MEKLHMIIITFPQVLIENDLHLGTNAKLDLESQKQNQKWVPRISYVSKSGIAQDLSPTGW